VKSPRTIELASRDEPCTWLIGMPHVAKRRSALKLSGGYNGF
jgi:hypothetical protein